MASTSTSTSTSSSIKETPPPEPTTKPVESDEYLVPAVDISREDEVALRGTVRTSDEAQQLFLQDKITEDELAMAVNLFGRPSNPSETVNRADAAYEKKLPKWVFSQPEGTGLTMEERQAEVEALSSEPSPLTHEQIVSMPPKEQAEAAKAAEGSSSTSSGTGSTTSPTPEKTS